MSSVAVSLPTYTEDEYLEIDRAAEVRSEYYDGVIVAMSGGSVWHSLIPANLAIHLSPAVRERGCLAYSSDLRIKIGKARSFVYPDLSVICGAPRFVGGTADIADNPILVAEVLSPSTERFDRTWKFEKYKTLESPREYLVIWQNQPRVELHSLNAKGEWDPTVARGRGATLEIKSLGVILRLDQIYFGVPISDAPDEDAQ